jgi:hypothetical protein
MQDVAETYGTQVGGAAKMAAGEALGAGLAANEQDLMKQQMDNQRKSSLLGAIGQGLGFVGSRLFPPAGAARAVAGLAGSVRP